MWMIVDINQNNLRHKSSLVVGGHVVDSSEHTTYSTTIKDICVWLVLMIAVKFLLGIMYGDIRNDVFTAPCVEKIWSTCGQ